jgi:hypothetical protein
MVQGLNSARDKNFSFLQNIQTGSGAHPASNSMGNIVYSPKGKVASCEVDRSPPSSAEVMSEWSYTSAPPLCLHGVDRDNLTFIILVLFIS